MAATPTATEVFPGMPPTFEVIEHLTSFLQWRFSCLPAGAYQWRPEGQDLTGMGQSEIFIGGDTPIDPVVVGQRPAITLLRASSGFQGVGLNDRAYINLMTGEWTQLDLIPTTVMINVLSQNDIEAERIAWFALEQIRGFREPIVKTLKSLCYLGQRPTMSAPSPAGSLVGGSAEAEWTVVVISMPVFLQHATTVLPLNRKVIWGMQVNSPEIE